MKRAFKILFGMTFLFALLVLPGHVALAALVKTTSIVDTDVWQRVTAGTLAIGNVGDISNSYTTIIYLEIAYADTDAQDGVEVSFEVSYGDDNWTLLTKPFTTPAGGVLTSTYLSGDEPAGETDVELNNVTDFGDNGLKWFIEDDGDDSESVRSKAISGNVITLCHDTLFVHNNTNKCWGIVYEYIIPVPTAYAYVRVLINNTDINADIYYTTRISKVTEL